MEPDYKPNVPEWWREEYREAGKPTEETPASTEGTAPTEETSRVVHINIFISTFLAFLVAYLISGGWWLSLAVAGFVLVICLKISRSKSEAQQ